MKVGVEKTAHYIQGNNDTNDVSVLIFLKKIMKAGDNGATFQGLKAKNCQPPILYLAKYSHIEVNSKDIYFF